LPTETKVALAYKFKEFEAEKTKELMQAAQFKAVEDKASKLVYTPQIDGSKTENTEKGRALEAIANLKQFFEKEETAETSHSTDSLPVGYPLEIYPL